MRRVFVTGGSGFIGSRLLPRLVQHGYTIAALDRSGRISERGAVPIQPVRGDLLEPATYRAALASAEIVVHLAASTGRASATEHHRTNALGTEALVRECATAGIRRLLFVSSIATTFDDLAGYPYAQAKARAEDAVASSPIPFTILRPTMVLGPGSPILSALSTLATLPVIPVLGDGRTLVQPAFVDDVVAFILQVLDEDRFEGETFDVAGPDSIPIEELLQIIRVERTGRRGPVCHIPLGLVLPVLRVADAVGIGRLLPATIGQLATFRFRGTARGNVPDGGLRPRLVGVREMVSRNSGTEPHLAVLVAECREFTRYLIGTLPTPYVVEQYIRAHGASVEFAAADAFDQYLVSLAVRHRVLTTLADSYGRIFAPASLLRRKLILLLAILETSSPGFREIDRPIGRNRMVLWGTLALKGAFWLIGLFAAAAIFLPLRFATGQRKAR